jgi:hypothetical protein
MKKYLITYKCESCNKYFATEDEAKQCPYCSSKNINFEYDKITKLNDNTENPYACYSSSRGQSERDKLTNILALLEDDSSITRPHFIRRVRKRNLFSYINLIEGLLKDVIKYKKHISYTDFIDYPFGDYNYIELRIVDKNKAVILGTCYQKELDADMIRDLTYKYTKNGWKYFYVNNSKLAELIYNISRYIKK